MSWFPKLNVAILIVEYSLLCPYLISLFRHFAFVHPSCRRPHSFFTNSSQRRPDGKGNKNTKGYVGVREIHERVDNVTDNHSKVSEKVTERRKVIVERVVAKALEKGTYKKQPTGFLRETGRLMFYRKRGTADYSHSMVEGGLEEMS